MGQEQRNVFDTAFSTPAGQAVTRIATGFDSKVPYFSFRKSLVELVGGAVTMAIESTTSASQHILVFDASPRTIAIGAGLVALHGFRGIYKSGSETDIESPSDAQDTINVGKLERDLTIYGNGSREEVSYLLGAIDTDPEPEHVFEMKATETDDRKSFPAPIEFGDLRILKMREEKLATYKQFANFATELYGEKVGRQFVNRAWAKNVKAASHSAK